MKTCPNCRCVYGDDYNGTCSDCGAPMGGTQANGSADLSFRFSRQTAAGRREDGSFSPESMKARKGNIDGLSIEQGIVDAARNFVIVDHEKLAELEAQADA